MTSSETYNQMLKCPLLATGGTIGACMKNADEGHSLGVIQISPQAASDGSLSILYMNGDKCKGNQRYSTRIILQCDQSMVSFCVLHCLIHRRS